MTCLREGGIYITLHDATLNTYALRRKHLFFFFFTCNDVHPFFMLHRAGRCVRALSTVTAPGATPLSVRRYPAVLRRAVGNVIQLLLFICESRERQSSFHPVAGSGKRVFFVYENIQRDKRLHNTVLL